jgi:hypothetical protein
MVAPNGGYYRLTSTVPLFANQFLTSGIESCAAKTASQLEAGRSSQLFNSSLQASIHAYGPRNNFEI